MLTENSYSHALHRTLAHEMMSVIQNRIFHKKSHFDLEIKCLVFKLYNFVLISICLSTSFSKQVFSQQTRYQ